MAAARRPGGVRWSATLRASGPIRRSTRPARRAGRPAGRCPSGSARALAEHFDCASAQIRVECDQRRRARRAVRRDGPAGVAEVIRERERDGAEQRRRAPFVCMSHTYIVPAGTPSAARRGDSRGGIGRPPSPLRATRASPQASVPSSVTEMASTDERRDAPQPAGDVLLALALQERAVADEGALAPRRAAGPRARGSRRRPASAAGCRARGGPPAGGRTPSSRRRAGPAGWSGTHPRRSAAAGRPRACRPARRWPRARPRRRRRPAGRAARRAARRCAGR